jgi:hypothetical protein
MKSLAKAQVEPFELTKIGQEALFSPIEYLTAAAPEAFYPLFIQSLEGVFSETHIQPNE